MLDCIKALINAFGSFVKVLFELPFIPPLSFGHMLLAIYVVGMILIFLIGKVK